MVTDACAEFRVSTEDRTDRIGGNVGEVFLTGVLGTEERLAASQPEQCRTAKDVYALERLYTWLLGVLKAIVGDACAEFRASTEDRIGGNVGEVCVTGVLATEERFAASRPEQCRMAKDVYALKRLYTWLLGVLKAIVSDACAEFRVVTEDRTDRIGGDVGEVFLTGILTTEERLAASQLEQDVYALERLYCPGDTQLRIPNFFLTLSETSSLAN